MENMTLLELTNMANSFINKRTKQKDNLVITRNEAITALVDFAKLINKEKDGSI